MKPQQWSLIWKTIRTHERVWISVAQQASGGAAEAIRGFLRFWDPIYLDAMDINALMSRNVYVPEDRFRTLLRGFWLARERAMRIGLGLSAAGVFYPKIDEPIIRIMKTYLPTPPRLAVAGDIMKPVPEAFHACVQACITPDHVLFLTCHQGGDHHRVSIDLKPIAAKVKEMIRRYHTHVLHGDMKQETIAGLGDWYRDSVRAAARIAHAKAAKKLWAKVQANYGTIEKGLSALGPYGQAAAIGIRTGMTVKKMLTRAKDGDPQAIEDVKAIVKLSKQGDPSADQVVKIMKAMNEMGKAKDEKTEAIGGWFFNRPYRIAAISPDMVLRGFYNLGVAS